MKVRCGCEADEPSSLGLGETKFMAVKSPGSPEGGRPWRGVDKSNGLEATASKRRKKETIGNGVGLAC